MNVSIKHIKAGEIELPFGLTVGTPESHVVWAGEYADTPDCVVNVCYALDSEGLFVSKQLAETIANAVDLFYSEARS